jgi:hypothetical protein
MSVDVRSEGGSRPTAAPGVRAPGLHLVPTSPPARLEAPGASSPLVAELESVAAAMAADGATTAHRRELDAVLGAWAHALVRTHGSRPTAASPVAPLPWVLDGPLPAWLDDLPPAAGPAWAVRAHPAVRRAVARTRASWTDTVWIHGAPTGDDVVLRCDDAGAWEAELPSPIGRGDARWDVATVLDWLAVALGSALAPVWRVDPGARFLAAYRTLGGDATPTRAMAVTRTLATAVEWSAQLVADSDGQDDDREWVAALWQRPLELVGVGRRP